jgi:hypothetical protein
VVSVQAKPAPTVEAAPVEETAAELQSVPPPSGRNGASIPPPAS